MTCANCESLRAELAPHRLHAAYKLSPQEAAVVLTLYHSGAVMSGERLAAKLPTRQWERRTTGSFKVAVSYIRRKMGRNVIGTEFGSGWYLTPHGREMVKGVVG